MISLLSHRVVFVGGKGGVGRSTISAALGLAASRRGLRTVIAEMNGSETMADIFGRGPVGYAGGELRPGLHAVSITPSAAVEEYLVRQLKFRVLYNLVFGNRFIEPFMNAVLGLSDLISVGKVMDLEWMVDATRPSGLAWDLVVVDAPATGHSLSMLRTPRTMMDITRVGPLYQNARLIRDLLEDHRRTCFLGVSLAEEMPVQEMSEMVARLRAEVPIELTGIVVNGVRPRPFDGDELAAFRAFERWAARHHGPAEDAARTARRMVHRRARHEAQIRQLAATVDLPLVEVPLLPHGRRAEDLLDPIAIRLEPWL